MYTTEELLNKIDAFIDRDEQEDYSIIDVAEVTHLTDLAALIRNEIDSDPIWIPFSVMRCDEDSHIYVKEWFYKKNF